MTLDLTELKKTVAITQPNNEIIKKYLASMNKFLEFY